MEYYWGATVGKMVMGIKVVNLQYQPLSAWQALLRYLPWLIASLSTFLELCLVNFDLPSGLIDIFYFLSSGHISGILDHMVYISAISIFFTVRYRCLHDFLAGTYCIYKEN